MGELGPKLTFGSLFAGIGGFDLGFEMSGASVRWQVERDVQAQKVLRHRFPSSVLYDDVRTVGAANLEPVDVICGGFPCQDVSVAGRREGLGGERTGLFWEVVRIARELEPEWMVLENVPGLLSSHQGRDFHACLEALADCGFRRAYRILDSRYFGVAQRRRRVFIVLRARRSGHGAEEVLLESESRGGDSAAGDEARTHVASTLRGRSHGAGVNAPGRGGEDDANLICGPLGGGNDGIGRRTEDDPNLVVGVHANQRGELRTSGLAGSLNGSRSGKQFDGVFATLNSGGNNGGFRTGPGEHLISSHQVGGKTRFDANGEDYVAYALRSDPGGTGQGHNTTYPGGVRRLTPLECERLQGFPDGWTCLCGEGHRGSVFCKCPDTPRYRQLGNAVTVPVAAWIGRRILEAEAVT